MNDGNDNDQEQNGEGSATSAEWADQWASFLPADTDKMRTLAERGAQDLLSVATSFFNRGGSNASPFGARAASPTEAGDPSTSIREMHRAIDTWADFAKNMLERMYQTSASQGDTSILRGTAAAGESAVIEWVLANPGDEDIEGVVITSTSLVSPSGQVLDSSPAINPAQIEVLHRKSTRSVTVHYQIDAAAMEATHRGLLQASQLDIVTPVEVTVQPVVE